MPRIAGPHLLPLRPVEQEGRITYRRHWWVLVRGLIPPGLLGLVEALIWVSFLRTRIELASGDLALWSGWVNLLALGGGCLPLFWAYWRYENWRNDYYEVTRDRVIDVKRLPLGLHSEVREAPLGNVQNVTLTIPSVLAASLDFGNIIVETAGNPGNLTFESIAHPHEVLRQVSARVDAYRAQRLAQQKADQEVEMLQWFSSFAELQRVSIVRNPPSVRVGDWVEIEWRVEGPAEEVITYLEWDTARSGPDSYGWATRAQAGGVGNYRARFRAPLAERFYLRVHTMIDGEVFVSRELGIPVTDFRVSYPSEARSGDDIEVVWWCEAPLDRPRLALISDQPQSREAIHTVLAESSERGYVANFMALPSGLWSFYLLGELDGESLVSLGYKISPGVSAVSQS